VARYQEIKGWEKTKVEDDVSSDGARDGGTQKEDTLHEWETEWGALGVGCVAQVSECSCNESHAATQQTLDCIAQVQRGQRSLSVLNNKVANRV
jgi:hypothetical protein